MWASFGRKMRYRSRGSISQRGSTPVKEFDAVRLLTDFQPMPKWKNHPWRTPTSISFPRRRHNEKNNALISLRSWTVVPKPPDLADCFADRDLPGSGL